jgi:hypothetical protein
VPTVRFARGKPAEIGALCRAKARQAITRSAPRHSASLQFAQLGAPVFPRSRSNPSGATFFAHHIMPRGQGGINREYAHLAKAFMETSENPILRADQTSQALKVGRYKFLRRRSRCTKTGMPTLSSTEAISCAVPDGVQANLRAN